MSATGKGIIIGGGIGGLVTSILLASRGFDITLLEKNETLGGKLQQVKLGAYAFDFGPSTLTMPWIFEKVFEAAGEPLDPELHFLKLDVNSRNHFEDGSVIDLSTDPDRMQEQLSSFSADDRKGFQRYLQEVKRIYTIAEEQFFSRSFAGWQDYVSPRLGVSLLSVHPFTAMDAFHRRFFQDPRLLAMMNRYATYVGSSPGQTPATLSMIAYLELIRGVYYLRGGNYKLIEALERLARKAGVSIRKGAVTERIEHKRGAVLGVQAAGMRLEADFVVSNVDVHTTQKLLYDQPQQSRASLSSSGFLCLLGLKKPMTGLHHHNLFFPKDYGSEFADMFDAGCWPSSPALYVCNSSYSEPERGGHNGAGSNLYVLINVPALAKTPSTPLRQLSVQEIRAYRAFILNRLADRLKLDTIEPLIEEEAIYTPQSIADQTGAFAGALYGNASHGWGPTFFRPSLADRKVQGLYYVGGTTHPGGGTPMVTLSGIQAAELISARHRKKTRTAL
ncbi:phytoene desaturase family protein [Paenibacillus sp. GD4]|uniref:phytoene desaturase family protein n=1 Tax=Paenibacillus sp. GD4 TaxID=3068890 RepID=UPI002796BAF8|nr:phytoene desaturase family protein [Paenibacillus sp. GD4]MDQ1909240.1 phytoene desaturase family protein [Paenibacillus sp. GD4]